MYNMVTKVMYDWCFLIVWIQLYHAIFMALLFPDFKSANSHIWLDDCRRLVGVPLSGERYSPHSQFVFSLSSIVSQFLDVPSSIRLLRVGDLKFSRPRSIYRYIPKIISPLLGYCSLILPLF